MEGVQVSFPGLGISFNVSPVAISFGSFNIYWYGILIAAGMVLCGFLALKQCKKNNFPDGLVYDVLLCGIPSAIVGARLYYVACEWGYYSQDLRRIFDTRSGGLAVYGGVIGAFLGVFIMCKIRKIPFMSIADYCVGYREMGQLLQPGSIRNYNDASLGYDEPDSRELSRIPLPDARIHHAGTPDIPL